MNNLSLPPLHSPMENPLLPRLIFLGVLIFNLIFTIWLIAGNKVPLGHDTFQYLTLQYYFLNHRIMAGDIPQWIPFIGHGTLATWFYAGQASPFQNFLLLTGWIPQDANFLPIFHLGFLIDELFFLVGMWLLSGKLLTSSLARFFVLLTCSGTTLWINQVWFNFHFFYFLPLILYFLHQFIDTQKKRYILLATNLVPFQLLGGLPYFLPMTTFVIFFYFLCYFMANPQSFSLLGRGLRNKWTLICFLPLALLSFGSVYLSWKIGTETIIKYSVGRGQDGRVSLDVFLTYGGGINFWKWLELLLGFSPKLDYSLYLGIACLPFLFLGLMAKPRQSFPLAATSAVLILVSAGLFPAHLVYYWPLMSYFRHLGGIGPLIKIFLILLAGLGFENLLVRGLIRKVPILVLMTLGIGTLTLCLFSLSRDPQTVLSMIDRMAGEAHYGVFQEVLVPRFLETKLLLSFALALLLLVCFIHLLALEKHHWLYPALAIVLIQITDLTIYKFYHLDRDTFSANADEYDVFHFQPMPFPDKRIHIPINFPKEKTQEKAKAFFAQWEKLAQDTFSTFPRAKAVKNLQQEFGSQYWTLDAFLFVEEVGSAYRMDFWQAPLDDYLRAYWKQDFDGRQAVHGHVPYRGLVFPYDHPAALKISASTCEKIQFFQHAYLLDSKQEVAKRISNPNYQGDILFLLKPVGEKTREKQIPVNLQSPREGQDFLAVNDRIQPEYRVTRFDSNHLEVEVENNTGKPIWMFYSDVWNPWWQATVNGKEQTIFLADLAYKAIEIEPGTNRVHFSCYSVLMDVIQKVLGVFSLLWTLAILLLAGQCFFGPKFPS